MTSLALWARRSPAVRTLAGPLLRVRRRVTDRGRRHRQETWERLRDLLAEDPVVAVREFGGEFQLDVRSHVLARLVLDGAYEPELARVCQDFADPARDAVDVGANAGFFSVLLAQHLPDRRVLAAEPSAAMAARLRANLERNGVAGRVAVFEGALSDRGGTAELRGPAGNEEYGTIGVLAHPAAHAVAGSGVGVGVETVASETLDALVERHGLVPGFVKIDVEGAEALVLGGARATLREFRPVLLSELDDGLLRANGSSAVDVVRLLQAEGYRVLHPTTPGHPPVSREQLEALHVSEVLCLPDGHPAA